MCHVPDLIHVIFAGTVRSFVYRFNNTRLAFQTSKTTICRPQTSELKSISKFQLLFHSKNFEK